MRNHIILIVLMTVVFVGKLSACAFAGSVDSREMQIDKILGGMEEGSRIFSPHGDIHAESHQIHATPGSHVGSAAETHHAGASGAGLGLSQSGALHASHVDATHAAVPISETHVSHVSAASASHMTATEGNHGVLNHGVIEESRSVETGSQSGTNAETNSTGNSISQGSGQETASGGSSQHSIIQVNTETNLNSSNPTANGTVTIDTNAHGGLIDANTATTANTAGQEITSGTSTQVESVDSSGSSQESPSGDGNNDHSIIEVNADANLNTDNPTTTGTVVIDPNAGGGLIDANTTTTTNTAGQEVTSGTSTQVESIGSSGSGQESTSSGQNSIIEVNANTNLSSENPNVTGIVTIDPNASGGLVDANAAVSTDVVEQEMTSNIGLQVDMGANTTAAETTTIGTEVGSTDVPATNEVQGGVEADVDAAGAGGDIGGGANAADGLPSTTTTTTTPHL